MKPTSRDDVFRVCCPRCDDGAYHLYVYTENRTGYCFHCSSYFNRHELKGVIELEQRSERASDLSLLDDPQRLIFGTLVAEKGVDVELPPSVPAWEDKRSRAYLRARGVPPGLVQRHNLRFCIEGLFEDRIVIPTYQRGRLVVYQGRDITGKKAKKYLFPLGAAASRYLFNLDFVRQDRWVIVVEGPFDALHLQSMSFPVAASFGKKLSQEQAALLERFRKVIIMYDADAHEQTLRYMSVVGDRALGVLLPRGDPTDFATPQVRKMLAGAADRLGVMAELLKRGELSDVTLAVSSRRRNPGL